MASSSEVGHAKNMANFESLISFCTGLGTSYNPSKSSLQITQLQTVLTNTKNNLANVIATNTAFNNAVNERVHAFEGLKKLSTQLVNALTATDASKSTINDAKMYNTKMQGKSVKPTKSDAGKMTKADSGKTETTSAETTTVDTTKSISTSQQSYDNVVEHFAKLIDVLASEPSYSPNETKLQTATLSTQLTDLKNKNTAVINAYTTVSNARITRNKSLYEDKTGLCDIAQEVKNYVKSIYGATAPEYKQISSLKFNKLKN